MNISERRHKSSESSKLKSKLKLGRKLKLCKMRKLKMSLNKEKLKRLSNKSRRQNLIEISKSSYISIRRKKDLGKNFVTSKLSYNTKRNISGESMSDIKLRFIQ